MKISCDVCEKDEASVFCTADEAALCATCDHRVHHANKLASKHQRFSLLYPLSSKEFPICDICQEKRAFLFCQQDRAILCIDCDIPIHRANEFTNKHNRFFLNGVKLSATSSLYKPSLVSSSSASLTSSYDSSVPKSNSQPLMKKPHIVLSPTVANQPPVSKPSSEQTVINKLGGESNLLVDQTSTISEYLIEMLPGWHVEDFLDPSLAFGFCENDDDGKLPYMDGDVDSSRNIGTSPSYNLGFWVPQAPQTPNQFLSRTREPIGFKESAPNMKLSDNDKTRSDDSGFTVPQISPQYKV